MVNLNFVKQDINYANVWVAKNVLDTKVAHQQEIEFLKTSEKYFKPYDNPLEKKSLLDDWSKFSSDIYKLIFELCSSSVISQLEKISGYENLMPDYGLHGAGLFLQKQGWHLNPHIDYKIHPKLGFERKLSLLLYLTEDWKKEYGGGLTFYNNDNGKPNYDDYFTICPEFNSLVVFECTTISWHGVNIIHCPSDIYRKAIGLFYLQSSCIKDGPMRARYAPQADQMNDPKIEDLIKSREQKRKT